MNTSQQIAKHFREVHFGGNWTSVNLKALLSDISWQEATTKIADTNTIATLVFHINYYVHHVLGVFNGVPLTASDTFSFDLPPISDEAAWQQLISKSLEEAELFAQQVEILPEAKLTDDFTDAKYGNYYRNIHGIIEHTHYHLGQIALLKKLVKQK